MRIECTVHGAFGVLHDPSTTSCPVCTIQHAQKQIERACDLNINIDCHWRDEIRCVDIYNYNAVRGLIPERCGVTVDGKKFMIEFDGLNRFQSMVCRNGVSDFEDQVHKDFAKLKYARDHKLHYLRISYEEVSDIDYWVNVFLDRCMTTTCYEKQVILCSNVEKYAKLQKRSEYFLREDRKLCF